MNEYSIYDPRFYAKEMTVEETFSELEGRFDEAYDKPIPLKQMENVQPYKTHHQYESMIANLCTLSITTFTSIKDFTGEYSANYELFRRYLKDWCEYHHYDRISKRGYGTKIIKKED